MCPAPVLSGAVVTRGVGEPPWTHMTLPIHLRPTSVFHWADPTHRHPHSCLWLSRAQPAPGPRSSHLRGPMPRGSRKCLHRSLEPEPNAPFSVKEAWLHKEREVHLGTARLSHHQASWSLMSPHLGARKGFRGSWDQRSTPALATVMSTAAAQQHGGECVNINF